MPVEVTKYTCQFRCRKKAVGEEKRMVRHERVCWKNPENKTCKTCKNEIYEIDKEYPVEVFRGCKISELGDALQKVSGILTHQNTLNVRPIYQCQYWNKEGDDNVAAFVEELVKEIEGEEEGTLHYPYFNKPEKKPIDPDEIPF